ncbi:hypothetical protein BT67DRAFT_308694 [Trichocladium antarcticum]|uniref:Uncharacterized protein n=1 Tax=Trichocladium antarcticum TaxID=1450529 RepID=A0AAN6UJX0_9PEZI|nr:hypothetical protein BT67DRAFT_308694 [Trichocladium antarcticum]
MFRMDIWGFEASCCAKGRGRQARAFSAGWRWICRWSERCFAKYELSTARDLKHATGRDRVCGGKGGRKGWLQYGPVGLVTPACVRFCRWLGTVSRDGEVAVKLDGLGCGGEGEQAGANCRSWGGEGKQGELRNHVPRSTAPQGQRVI